MCLWKSNSLPWGEPSVLHTEQSLDGIVRYSCTDPCPIFSRMQPSFLDTEKDKHHSYSALDPISDKILSWYELVLRSKVRRWAPCVDRGT